MSFIKAYVVVLIAFAVIDVAWLTVMNATYRQWIGHLMAANVALLPAILFYILYTLGITLLVVMPGRDGTLLDIALHGALLGLIAYGTYDLSNAATLRDWPWVMTITDIAWGTTLTALTSLAAGAVLRWL